MPRIAAVVAIASLLMSSARSQDVPSRPRDPRRCGEERTVREAGHITSPGYPEQYPPRQRCKWLLRAATPEQQVSVTFNPHFNIERNDCRFDYVELHDGEGDLADLIGRFCGNVAPGRFVSSGSTLSVTFVSDFTQETSGFSLHYDIYQPTGKDRCSHKFSGPFGVVTSPGFPDKYPDYQRCTYTVRAGTGRALMLTFHTFHLEESDRQMGEPKEREGTCQFDWLEIWDGLPQVGFLVGRFCGGDSPGTLHSATGILSMHLHTDDAIARDGFYTNYTTWPLLDATAQVFVVMPLAHYHSAPSLVRLSSSLGSICHSQVFVAMALAHYLSAPSLVCLSSSLGSICRSQVFVAMALAHYLSAPSLVCLSSSLGSICHSQVFVAIALAHYLSAPSLVCLSSSLGSICHSQVFVAMALAHYLSAPSLVCLTSSLGSFCRSRVRPTGLAMTYNHGYFKSSERDLIGPNVSRGLAQSEPECFRPLGVESQEIQDAQISVSSVHATQEWLGHQGRLHYPHNAWSPARDTQREWIQVDLRTLHLVSGVATQGAVSNTSGLEYYVKRFRLEHSTSGKVWTVYRHRTKNKAFIGNVGAYSVAEQHLPEPILARYVRFKPMSWYQGIAMRIEIYGCTLSDFACSEPMGIISGQISNDSITASSTLGSFWAPSRARLLTGVNGWAPANPHGPGQWLQVDIGRVRMVSGVIIQGADGIPTHSSVPGSGGGGGGGGGERKPENISGLSRTFVRKFLLKTSLNGEQWSDVVNDEDNKPKVFLGSSNMDRPELRRFTPLSARFVRLYPERWASRGIGLRLELLGCDVPAVTTPVQTESPTPAMTTCPDGINCRPQPCSGGMNCQPTPPGSHVPLSTAGKADGSMTVAHREDDEDGFKEIFAGSGEREAVVENWPESSSGDQRLGGFESTGAPPTSQATLSVLDPFLVGVIVLSAIGVLLGVVAAGLLLYCACSRLGLGGPGLSSLRRYDFELRGGGGGVGTGGPNVMPGAYASNGAKLASMRGSSAA
uniref:neuropilin-2-like n=1 Tax=Myxine glutinosa TaxID=7769 RepID=UPI00358F8A25